MPCEMAILSDALPRILGVPKITLHGHLKIDDEKPALPHGGTCPVFTGQQETDFLQYLLTLSKFFYGLTPLELRRLAFEFAKKNNIE